jgi:hypothetical protein
VHSRAGLASRQIASVSRRPRDQPLKLDRKRCFPLLRVVKQGPGLGEKPLDPEGLHQKAAPRLLKFERGVGMTAISTRANTPKNDDAWLLEPMIA